MVQIPGAGRPDDVYDEPRSGRLVAWGNAVLGGSASPDDAAEAVRGADDGHRVEGVPGAEGAGLTLALGRLRALGVTGLRLALPAPGHPLGLTGPPSFNSRALEAYRRRRAPMLLAPGYPPRAVRVLESARQVRAMLVLAATGDGAAVSAGEMAARAEALRPLGRTVRRAQAAAYNAMVDEPTLR